MTWLLCNKNQVNECIKVNEKFVVKPVDLIREFLKVGKLSNKFISIKNDDVSLKIQKLDIEIHFPRVVAPVYQSLRLWPLRTRFNEVKTNESAHRFLRGISEMDGTFLR